MYNPNNKKIMNKVRKASVVCMMVMMVCGMTSCLDNVKSDYTPRILVSELYVNPYYVKDTLYARDTISIRYNTKSEKYMSDTMLQGDTVMFGVAFDAQGNNLVSTRVEWDSTTVQAWFGINDDIKKALSDTTDLGDGSLSYVPGYNVASFPVYLLPKKAGSHTIKMTIETDSKYSPVSNSFDLIVE